MSNDSISTFFNAWEVYDQVLDHDYMFHDRVHHDLDLFLSRHFNQQPFSVLDLGCGSARHMAATLARHRPSLYVGYDISSTALEHAREASSRLDAEVRLHEGDLLEALNREVRPFDLIFSGYALHHLKEQEKRAFFQASKQLISASGVLVILDLVRDVNEGRVDFLSRYCRWVEADWSALSKVAVTGIQEHVMSADYPEAREDLIVMAKQAGYINNTPICEYGCHQAIGCEV